MADQSLEQLIEELRRKDEAEKMAQGQIESGAMVPQLDPKAVLPSALKQKAALEAQRNAIIDEMKKKEEAATEEFKKSLAPSQMPSGPGKEGGTTVSLPQTYAALEEGQKRLSDLEKKMVVPRAEPDRLAEALLAAIPTLLGVGIGAATKRPGMVGAGLAAGGAGAMAGLKELKETGEKERAAKVKAAEERLQRQTTLEKSYLDAVAKAETYPYEAQLIAAKSASPELAKEALEKMRANTNFLKDRAESKADKAKLDGIDKQLQGLQDLIKQQTTPQKPKGPAKEKAGKTLTAEQAAVFSGIEASKTQLSDLEAAIASHETSMGPVKGRMTVLNPYDTEAKTFNSKMRIAAQRIGTTLERGKLTDADFNKYLEMLPKISDTPDVARGKVQNVNLLLEQMRAAEIDTLSKAGYDVNKLSGGGLAPAGKSAPSSAAAELEKVRKEREELERKLSKGKK